MASIVNVKVKFIRPKYKNLQEWMKDEKNVYIGRRGVVFIDKKRFPKNNSIFANPFKISKNLSRDDVIKKYEEYITNRLKNEPKLREELNKLKDKNLGCWCHPEKCHGDILLKLLN